MPFRDLAPAGHPCWIDLFTSDPARARAFYGELFDWTSEANEEFGGYINFSRDGVMVAGGMGNDGQSGTPDMWSVYLAVDDADATTAAAVAAGAQVIVPPMPVGELGTMAVILDTGGAAIGMWQPGLHKGFGVLAEPRSGGWFELHTRDFAGSLAFYRDVFSWDVHVMSDTDEFRYATLDKDERAAAGIMDASGFLPDGVPAAWSVYFSVDDVDATIATAVELGGSIVMAAEDTPFGRLATLADPTGAIFKLVGPNVA